MRHGNRFDQAPRRIVRVGERSEGESVEGAVRNDEQSPGLRQLASDRHQEAVAEPSLDEVRESIGASLLKTKLAATS